MKSKRILSITLAALLAFCSMFALSSCTKDGEDKKEDSSSSETVKDEKKKDDKKYAFDLTGIEDEELRTLADRGALKKHIDLLSADEIESIIDAIFGADYYEAGAEEYVDAFEPMFKKNYKYYDRDEQIASIQAECDQYGISYRIAKEGNYIICVELEDFDEIYNDGFIAAAVVYNSKTDKLYTIDSYSKGFDEGTFGIEEIVFYEDSEAYFLLTIRQSDYSVAFGHFYDHTIASAVWYDGKGNMVTAKAEDNYYDSELNLISEEKYEGLTNQLEESVNS